MKILNLGILAHVDAGKTSLTERLLFNHGVIDHIGSVDSGDTQTDSLALERQRGITIKSAVVSFVSNDVTVNLIDTPGHSDFIAEVERVLSVLDAAVLVISAVEGVQPQTRILLRTLQRLRIPTIIFVNKLDRMGADYNRVCKEITEKLTPDIVSMGQAHDSESRKASFEPYDGTNSDFIVSLAETLSHHDNTILDAYVKQANVSYSKLREALAQQAKQALAYPVYAGSAITGAGVKVLADNIAELLPTTVTRTDGSTSGTVFKIERGPAGEKLAYLRLFTGVIQTRNQLPLGENRRGKVTAISVFHQGSSVERSHMDAGEIGVLRGLSNAQIGDEIGARRMVAPEHHFAPPTLETVIAPVYSRDLGALHAALTQLAEQDPLINLRQDDTRNELYVSLYGEVQKEVIQATLVSEYGIEVEFRETTTICIERIMGKGAAFEINSREANPAHPFLATIGLRVEPAPTDTGIQFRLEVSPGSMPAAFFRAVEEAVHDTLQQGLYGWQVTDCIVTMTHSGYWPRQSHAHATFDKSMSSTAGDFRNLTPLILMRALKQAGAVVCHPWHSFRLEMPASSLSEVTSALAGLRAIPRDTSMRGESCVLKGTIPAAHIHEFERMLPGLTSGEGVLEVDFDRYEPINGDTPSRPRTDYNPLNQSEYLKRVLRRF
jgi:ribosomal protection tetracycline resistance protein